MMLVQPQALYRWLKTQPVYPQQPNQMIQEHLAAILVILVVLRALHLLPQFRAYKEILPIL
jgi:hypothetical protein